MINIHKFKSGKLHEKYVVATGEACQQLLERSNCIKLKGSARTAQ
jgi:hypothetical protein